MCVPIPRRLFYVRLLLVVLLLYVTLVVVATMLHQQHQYRERRKVKEEAEVMEEVTETMERVEGKTELVDDTLQIYDLQMIESEIGTKEAAERHRVVAKVTSLNANLNHESVKKKRLKRKFRELTLEEKRKNRMEGRKSRKRRLKNLILGKSENDKKEMRERLQDVQEIQHSSRGTDQLNVPTLMGKQNDDNKENMNIGEKTRDNGNYPGGNHTTKFFITPVNNESK